MSRSNYDRKRELECLRLASDLMHLAADTVNPHLQARCVWMAKVWSVDAGEKPAKYARAENTGSYSLLFH